MEEFQETRTRLLAQGYQEKNVTFSSGKAMIVGAMYGLPLVVLFGLLYRLFLIDRAHLSEASGLSFFLLLIGIVAVSTAVHELLHGIGWAVSSGKGWDVIRFQFHEGMPSCVCKTALERRQYLIGVLAPFVVLGLASVLLLVIYPGTVSMLAMMVNFIAPGADLMIARNVLREGEGRIIDHPVEAGYVLFYK